MKQSQRTKNKLNEHPELVRMVPDHEGRTDIWKLEGKLCYLFICQCHNGGDIWMGWLPADELPEEFGLNARPEKWATGTKVVG